MTTTIKYKADVSVSEESKSIWKLQRLNANHKHKYQSDKSKFHSEHKIWYSRTSTSFPCLKMICNDFLVVKVNCWSYVFNIMKYMWILRNVKNKNTIEKNVWKCAPMIRKWWRHTRKTQPNHAPNSLLSVECWQPIVQQHIGMTINVAIGS